MANEATTLYSILVKPRMFSPYRRGWAWNPKTEKYDRVWISNWSTVYIRRNKDGSINYRMGPAPGFKKNLTAGERGEVIKWARRRGWITKLGPKVFVKPYPFLAGDVDMNDDLCRRLNEVGREVGSLWIASGCRTRAEQQALYDQNMIAPGVPKPGRPLTALPGTSNHEGCGAADTHLDGRSIGHSTPARAAMRRHGLCLPVPGEPWHVEVGSVWRA